jgi:uracil-DNA glycosylase
MNYDIKTCDVLKCNKCDISIDRKQIVNGYGNINSKILFIGEAPGYYEDKHGVPFVGASGNLFNNLLNHIGLSRKDVYVTNVLKCRPPRNRTPLVGEVNNCLDYLKFEIATLNPKIVILLGNIAFRTYFGNHKLAIKQYRGRIIPIKDRYIIPMYHPSYILYNKDNRDLINSYYNDFITISKLYRYCVNPLLTVKY